jgi:hypothetical protein
LIPIWEFADLPAFDGPAEPVHDGLPPHAAANSARAAVAMMAAAVRAGRGHVRRGRRTTRVLSFTRTTPGRSSYKASAFVQFRLELVCM